MVSGMRGRGSVLESPLERILTAVFENEFIEAIESEHICKTKLQNLAGV